MSRQKEVIYEIVASTMSHPTADWIYQKARGKMPRISLGTVYRNLKTLSSEGRLLEITTSRGASRYDANISRHSHLKCVGCELLIDVPDTDIDFVPRSSQTRRFKVFAYHVEFLGLCPDCRKTKQSKHYI